MWQINVSVIDSDWTVRNSGSVLEIAAVRGAVSGLRWYLGTDRRVLPRASAVLLYLAWAWLDQGHTAQIFWSPLVGTSGRCVTVLPPPLCGVALEILQSLEWRNNRNQCLLSASPYENPLLWCWKVISNRILSTEMRLLLISSMNRGDKVWYSLPYEL